MEERPVVGSHAIYLQQQSEIEGLLLDLEENAQLLTHRHKERLRRLAGGGDGHETYTIDNVTAQYAMVKKIQSQLLDDDGALLERFDVKALSGLITSISSLVNLFMRNEDKINHLREVSDLQEALGHVVKDFAPEDQRKFFRRLEELKTHTH